MATHSAVVSGFSICFGCSPPPSSPCGDGNIQSYKGETCDDGNTNTGDGCDYPSCKETAGW